ncbi:hypothetical protein HYS31_07665 [Candidatus Woesearchaeota archaeon]|nr:hypothetical protein [Candidatus Woesearchaeota archaeon]
MKAFNKWGTEGIKVDDAGLQPLITLEPRIVPKTGARYAGNKFHKSRVFIVERLINKLMVPGHKSKKHYKTSYHITGKAGGAYHRTFNTKKSIVSSLAEEIISAYRLSSASNAITRKLEIERQADSSR